LLVTIDGLIAGSFNPHGADFWLIILWSAGVRQGASLLHV
jgi:hypothetical protein